MRINDLLRTVVANMGDGTGATVTRWRQCIDLLAQYDVSGAQVANAIGAEDRDAILGLIEHMRTRVSADQRIASIVELGPRLRSPALVRLLAQDHPSLVTAMMANVCLVDADWAAIIPDLGPLARSVLRRRRDLEPLAQATLMQFGAIDMALPSLVAVEALDLVQAQAPEPEAAPQPEWPIEQPSQIGKIVEQIERFKEARASGLDGDRARAVEAVKAAQADRAARASVRSSVPQVNEFTFETDTAGLVTLVAGAPRGAAIGLSIGMAALDSRHGADGMALGAFRRRAAFENARFSVGEGALEGEWRMSAEPRFDRQTGRFFGYTGSARRELPSESLVRGAPGDGAQGWAGLSANSTRQLIHELRTPLNAIQGYAEMIEAQLVGPVSDDYREMASGILSDARALIMTFDDLDMASRIERGDNRQRPEQIDVAELVNSVVGAFDGTGKGAPVEIALDDDLPLIGGDRAQIERMLGHLVRAGCAALAQDEWLSVTLGCDPTGTAITLSVARPLMLRQLADQDLFDHGYLVDQKLRDAPPLGLAFTLKLVRGIANHLGGAFVIGPDSFDLRLPVPTVSEQVR